jgi:hypothetical protein
MNVIKIDCDEKNVLTMKSMVLFLNYWFIDHIIKGIISYLSTLIIASFQLGLWCLLGQRFRPWRA